MPQVDIHLVKDVLNAEQKKQVIQKLTGLAPQHHEPDRKRHGKPLTTEAVKELAAGRHAA